MDNIHSLLKRQMKRYLAGVNPSPEFQAFLEAVNRAYFDFDADRNMLERSFDFSSQELLQANVGFRKANEELQKLAAVVQHSTELISLADASGRLLFLNEAGCRMLGIDPADVSRHALPDLMAEGSRVRFESEMLPALREEQGWEGELQYRNMQTGVRIDVHSILFSVKGAADSSYMANIALDITESNKIAQSLRDSEQFLAGVFTGIQDGIMVLDRDLRILRMNATMEKWFADGLPATGKKCFELCHHSSKPCNLCPIQRTLSTGKADREVLPRRGTGGKIAGWLEQFSFPLVDRSTGEVVGAIEYVRDITERKKSEDALRKAYADLKSMQDQLLQSEKMATVGQLAAGVAHEVNNPTAFVTSNLEVLGKYVSDLKVLLEKCDNVEYHLRASGTEGAGQLADDIQMIKEGQELDFILSDLPNLINESLDGMHRIQRIVADLRTFSHSDEGHWEEADLHELIQSALNIAWNEIKYKADVVKDYAELPRIQCYPQQLSQVFLNLLVNAIQSIEAKGTITLRTRLEGEMVLVEIADTGCGMTEEVLRRVFEPFFTTKPVGKGTGLGLSLAYNIIEKHGGTISVTSRLGEGSTFSVRLPKG